MSEPIVEALTRLAEVGERQIAEGRRREELARRSSPEFQAEMVAIRQPLHTFSPLAFVRAMPHVYAEAFDTSVPDQFYTRVDSGHYLVACPCGNDHTVTDRGSPVAAECGRTFLFDGSLLRVAFTPASTARPES